MSLSSRAAYLFVAIFLILSMTGYANAESPVNTVLPKPFPVKIGVLSDSQITTQNGVFDYGLRKTAADKIVNVAIRPAALEYLAEDMLAGLLKELEKEKVDVILYLGDGANSGCKDELNAVFKVLSDFTARTRIPAYFLIGNHDYLGMGNQSNMVIRKHLCQKFDCQFNGDNKTCEADANKDNPAETKREVLTRIDDFNKSSATYDNKFKYEGMLDSKKVCHNSDNDFSHYEDYYVGRLTYKPDASLLEVIMTDTSDYRDNGKKSKFARWKNEFLHANGAELNGAEGAISFNGDESQLLMIKKNSNPDVVYRVFASHYPIWELQGRNQYADGLLPDGKVALEDNATNKLAEVLSTGSNYWLSGHTHAHKPEVKSYDLKGSKTLYELNVGSTTDYSPHALIFEKACNDKTCDKIDNDKVSYRVVPYAKKDGTCKKILKFARQHGGNYADICGSSNVGTKFGMDKEYRNDECSKQANDKKQPWSPCEVKSVRENIDKLISDYVASKVDSGRSADELRSEVVACLTTTAGYNELSWWDSFWTLFE